MEERGNKTIMCSVLFLDIVEYSKMSVSGQISLKDRFNSYLSAAIRDVPVADRIILDTGDGAAINFLGDIEDALKAALSLRESILNEDSSLNPPLLVRVGINLGRCAWSGISTGNPISWGMGSMLRNALWGSRMLTRYSCHALITMQSRASRRSMPECSTIRDRVPTNMCVSMRYTPLVILVKKRQR